MADRTAWSWPRRLAAGVLLVAALLVLAFAAWVPSNRELAARLAAEAERSLGVPVRIGEVRWQLFPLALVVEDVSTGQPAPIRIGRMVVEPVLSGLLRRPLRFHDVAVADVMLPQTSLRALRVQRGPTASPSTALLVERLRFQRLTWLNRQGDPLVFDGHLAFDAGWLPREGELARTETATPTRVVFRRLGAAQRWQLDAKLGGGTAVGELALAEARPAALQLSGHLELRGVEVQSALAAFERHSVLRGKAHGRTELSASGSSLPELVRSLHTRTRFSMAPATLLRIDIDKAIRSFGKDRAGQTRMASLAGQMDTQNTADGVVFRYRGLQAHGDTFSARGAATIANRRVNAEGTVDLAGVPLRVSGPLAAPEVSVLAAVSPTVTAGAAIGTAILPGVGTVVGAGVGAAIDKLLGGGPDPASAPAGPAAPRAR